MALRKSEDNYLLSFQRGEEGGFEYFFNTYYKALCFCAARYIQNESKVEIEDIVCESFMKVWEKREQFETEAGLRGYLYKTVYHGCLRWKERQLAIDNGQKAMGLIADRFEKDFLENMIRAETVRRVYAAMEELPAECRKVFVKLFVEGKSVTEAADELKVAVSTVKNQKARGIRLLRMRLTSFLLFYYYIDFMYFLS